MNKISIINIKLNFCCFLFLLIFVEGCINNPTNLEFKLQKLELNQVLLIESRAIDEFLIWSPDSNYIGFNIKGKWYKLNLRKMELSTYSWRGKQPIAIVSNGSGITEEMTREEIQVYKNTTLFNPRIVTNNNGITVELETRGFGTALLLTKKGELPLEIWASEMENCHSISLSPNNKFVTFISELNGIILLRI